jgi:hypothetical protein
MTFHEEEQMSETLGSIGNAVQAPDVAKGQLQGGYANNAWQPPSPEQIAAQEKAQAMHEARYAAERERELKQIEDRLERETRTAALQFACTIEPKASTAEELIDRATEVYGFLTAS